MAYRARTGTDHYLSFRLGRETYALDVGNAREIVECSTVTQIPKTPPWIRGVINLRGKVVPVIDLKMKFDMGQTEETVNTCVIVVEAVSDGEMYVVGMLADAAKEVFELDEGAMEPPPRFGTKLATHYIRGMVKRGDELLVILDAERVFSLADVAEAQEVLEESDIEEDDDSQAEDSGTSTTGIDAGWEEGSHGRRITVSQGA
ncbi:MAG: chemotaxis protein CheW [Myxococcota bacterium]